MNVERGDWAIVVAGKYPGLIVYVECRAWAEAKHFGDVPTWWVSGNIPGSQGAALPGEKVGVRALAPDHALRPLRDEHGTDQMIQKAGRPNDRRQKTRTGA